MNDPARILVNTRSAAPHQWISVHVQYCLGCSSSGPVHGRPREEWWEAAHQRWWSIRAESRMFRFRV